MTETTNEMSHRNSLVVALRLLGLLDLCAFAAATAPRSWIALSHEGLGLGAFPQEPITGYLARCTSVWCGLYGLLLWFVASDVSRYSRLITLLACAMIVHGLALIAIDLAEGMPGWWTATEGPCCSALGVLLLVLQRREAKLPYSVAGVGGTANRPADD